MEFNNIAKKHQSNLNKLLKNVLTRNQGYPNHIKRHPIVITHCEESPS